MDWQPISTAPKDESKFWGLVGEDAISMFWHPGFEKFVSSFSRMTLREGDTFVDTGLGYCDHHPVAHKPKLWAPRQLPASDPTP